jgi:hypothetical protein
VQENFTLAVGFIFVVKMNQVEFAEVETAIVRAWFHTLIALPKRPEPLTALVGWPTKATSAGSTWTTELRQRHGVRWALHLGAHKLMDGQGNANLSADVVPVA